MTIVFITRDACLRVEGKNFRSLLRQWSVKTLHKIHRRKTHGPPLTENPTVAIAALPIVKRNALHVKTGNRIVYKMYEIVRTQRKT